MWQGHLIRRVSPQASPRHAPPRRRLYTPTPDGFERFLRECLVLARGEGTPSRVRRPQPQHTATRQPRLR